MKQVRFLPLLLLAFTCYLLPGCSLNEKQLKEGWWKYGAGYCLGDAISFKEGFTVNGDTILESGKPVGIITRKTKRFFEGDNEIEITSLDKKQTGTYYQK